jgi:hypothetical protein
MNAITLKFESPLSEESLESLFDTLATILPSDLYTENKVITSDGVETDYNVSYHESMGYHCYQMPITRELSIQEGKTVYETLDKAIDGDYFLEMTAQASELQNRYKFNNFQGAIQEGDLD